MVNVQRAERCKRKMAFSLKVKKRSKKRFWHRNSESWAGDGELPGRGGLDLVLPINGAEKLKPLRCQWTSMLILIPESQEFQNIGFSIP